MSRPPRLLVSGLVCADITFRLGEMPRLAEKYRADDVRISLGGGGAIAAVAMQRIGADVQLAGRLGNDLFAELLRTELLRRSVGHALLVCVDDGKSPVSSVFVDKSGDRQIVNYRGPDEESSTFEPCDVLDVDLLQALVLPDAVLVDTRWEAAAVQILSYARQAGITAVIDAEAPVSTAAMELASHIAFSRQGLRDFASTEDIEQGLRMAQEQFACWVCVTDGEQGVYWLDAGELAHVAAFPVKAVDTLGAGDVWHAAFTLRLASGCSERAAMIFANAAAALKCQSPDGLDGIPDEAAVITFMEQRTPLDSCSG